MLEIFSREGKDQEAFVMLGLIFSLLFFAIIGITTGQALALIF